MKNKDLKGFADFGRSFQEKFVILVAKNRNFADQMAEVLDIQFLEFIEHQWIVNKIFLHKDKYGEHPSNQVLETLIKTDLLGETELLQDKVRALYGTYLAQEDNLATIEDEAFIKEKSLDFCKKQKLYEAMSKSVDLLEKSSFEEISSLINDAMKLGLDNDCGYDYVEDFEDRYQIKHRNPISTGWDQIDQITQGGLGSGELGVVLAATGGGKSMLMTFIGAQAVKAGKSVIHYTLELSDTHVGNRYDSCITGIELDELHLCKEAIFETVKNLDGRLLIKEYPTKTASTKTLRNHLEKLRQRKIPIDMIIVDYADLLRPIKNYREKRNELESIYEDLRAIAQDYECPLWTCSQVNRGGLNAEIITMESISEAFNKCFVSDFIFSLSRTITDKNTNQGRVYIAKNRNGPDGLVFPVFMVPKIVNIKILPKPKDGELFLEDEQESSEKRLREKFKKYVLEKS